MKKNNKKCIALLLVLSLLFTACGNTTHKEKSTYSTKLAQTLPSVEVAKAFIEKQKNVKQEKVDASDIESIKSGELELLYAYYTANGTTSEGLLRWYISATGGSLRGYIFSLGDIETISGIEKVSWREVSKNAATVDVVNNKVIVANIADNPTHTFMDWGLGVQKNYESIQEDIELIRNSTVNVRWYFFQAPNNSWYIVDDASTIYKFETKNGKYDWQSVDTSGENFELYIEGGKRMFRVKVPNQAPQFNLSTTEPIFDSIVISDSTQNVRAVHSEDMDKDGDIDVLSTSSSDGSVVWYENNGTNSFVEHNISLSNVYASSIKAVDIDDDGDMDVLATADSRIMWYENDANQTFIEHNLSTTANSAMKVNFADINGDSKKDIVAISRSSNTIFWYENNGSNFIEHTIETGLSGLTALDVADVNGDNHIDFVAGLDNTENVVLYLNDGNQSFTAQTVATIEAESVKFADLNNDGHMDIVTAEDDNNRIFWYENNGTLSFTEHLVADEINGAFSVGVKDIDNDGILDIYSASSNDNTVRWYKYDGNETFIVNIINSSANGASFVDANDIDGDGKMDVLSALTNVNSIVWYKQTIGFNVYENNSSLETLLVEDLDGDTLTYTLSGEDAHLFEMNSTTGRLAFIGSPNFENPNDVNGDNIYSIVIVVTDGTETVSQELSIVVEDVADIVPSLSNTTHSVTENSQENAYVGRININSRGDSDIISMRLEGTNADKFYVNNNGEIYVAYGANIDYEVDTEFNLTAYATNSAGESIGASLTINILDMSTPILITTPLYSSDSNFTFSVKGDYGDLLWIDGVESNLTFDVTPIEVTMPKDDNNTVELQAKNQDNILSSKVSFNVYETLNINLEEQNISAFVASTQRSGKFAKYYSFKIKNEHNITIDMIANFDTYLYLLDENGTRLYSNDDGGVGVNSKLKNLILQSGFYIIEATTYGSRVTGQFDLNITDNTIEVDTTPPTTPTLITTPVTDTNDSNISVEINGEVGSSVYVNGVEVATVEANGTAHVIIALNVGENNISITLRDEVGNESEALSFLIMHLNTAPIALEQNITVEINGSKNIILRGTDVNGDTLTYTIVTQPIHGILSGSDENITYTPNIDYNGSDSFTFIANDGMVNSEVSEINISVTSIMVLNVGYYDLNLNEGSIFQEAPIVTAGDIAMNVGDLSVADLSQYDILFVQNPSNSGYSSIWSDMLDSVSNFVSNGGVLLFHDRRVTDADSMLPGASSMLFIRDTNDDNTTVLLGNTVLTDGSGGILTDTSLDYGSSSHHGYIDSSTVPVEAIGLLSKTDSTQWVTLQYPYGDGYVVYSTIPLDYYLNGNVNYEPFSKIYAPNIIDYAEGLFLD